MVQRIVKINRRTMKTLEELKKLQAFDSLGRIYIPKHIRDQFHDCRFYIEVVDGKIILDPVKIEYVDEEDKSVESKG
jgi:bifunctional DNA-binding transcriptional regulator/antitoxin component of YhaV-PrlF toxin-antitoxin module